MGHCRSTRDGFGTPTLSASPWVHLWLDTMPGRKPYEHLRVWNKDGEPQIQRRTEPKVHEQELALPNLVTPGLHRDTAPYSSSRRYRAPRSGAIFVSIS